MDYWGPEKIKRHNARFVCSMLRQPLRAVRESHGWECTCVSPQETKEYSRYLNRSLGEEESERKRRIEEFSTKDLDNPRHLSVLIRELPLYGPEIAPSDTLEGWNRLASSISKLKEPAAPQEDERRSPREREQQAQQEQQQHEKKPATWLNVAADRVGNFIKNVVTGSAAK